MLNGDCHETGIVLLGRDDFHDFVAEPEAAGADFHWDQASQRAWKLVTEEIHADLAGTTSPLTWAGRWLAGFTGDCRFGGRVTIRTAPPVFGKVL
jgi:hypothetical protein